MAAVDSTPTSTPMRPWPCQDFVLRPSVEQVQERMHHERGLSADSPEVHAAIEAECLRRQFMANGHVTICLDIHWPFASKKHAQQPGSLHTLCNQSATTAINPRDTPIHVSVDCVEYVEGSALAYTCCHPPCCRRQYDTDDSRPASVPRR